MSEIIRLKHVIKMNAGGIRTVNDVSFAIAEKEHTVISGVSGSGKRTLMRMIAGMEKPSDGSIKVLGEDVHNMDENEAAIFRNKNIGAVFSKAGLMEKLNVLENTAMPLAVRRLPRSKRYKAAKEQLNALGMGHIARAYPKHLSKYEIVMVAFARALVLQPKILLLYNVTSGLSEKESEELNGVIGALSQYGDCTIINFNAADNAKLHADRRIQLKHGKILEDN